MNAIRLLIYKSFSKKEAWLFGQAYEFESIPDAPTGYVRLFKIRVKIGAASAATCAKVL